MHRSVVSLEDWLNNVKVKRVCRLHATPSGTIAVQPLIHVTLIIASSTSFQIEFRHCISLYQMQDLCSFSSSCTSRFWNYYLHRFYLLIDFILSLWGPIFSYNVYSLNLLIRSSISVNASGCDIIRSNDKKSPFKASIRWHSYHKLGKGLLIDGTGIFFKPLPAIWWLFNICSLLKWKGVYSTCILMSLRAILFFFISKVFTVYIFPNTSGPSI